MSADMIERLRFLASGQDDPHSVAITEAADEIERLRALFAESRDFWVHYSCLDQPDQDDIDDECRAMLAKMKGP